MRTMYRVHPHPSSYKILKMSSFKFKSPLPHALYFGIQLVPVLDFHLNYFHFENFSILRDMVCCISGTVSV